MSHSQSGILKEHSRFGIFIEAQVQEDLWMKLSLDVKALSRL